MPPLLTAATLLLAGGAGLVTTLLVAPVRSRGRMAALLLLSVVALGVGTALLIA